MGLVVCSHRIGPYGVGWYESVFETCENRLNSGISAEGTPICSSVISRSQNCVFGLRRDVAHALRSLLAIRIQALSVPIWSA